MESRFRVLFLIVAIISLSGCAATKNLFGFGNEEAPPPTSEGPGQVIDPEVERVIRRCLEAEPRDRPRSAMAVAAALPGGDPLAAALAAGETPSPEMVAAAGEAGTLRPMVAGVLLAIVFVELFAVALLSSKASVVNLSAPELKPPRAFLSPTAWASGRRSSEH